MITRKEFLFMWLPLMVISAAVFAVMVVNRKLDTFAAVALVVIIGILLKFIARKINASPAPSQPTPESEPTNDVQ